MTDTTPTTAPPSELLLEVAGRLGWCSHEIGPQFDPVLRHVLDKILAPYIAHLEKGERPNRLGQFRNGFGHLLPSICGRHGLPESGWSTYDDAEVACERCVYEQERQSVLDGADTGPGPGWGWCRGCEQGAEDVHPLPSGECGPCRERRASDPDAF